MIPGLPESSKQAYDAIKNIGVVCLIFKLKRSVTPNFWMNVSDPEIKIPGFVEFSNLRPTGDTIVYVPYYMPVDNPIWRRSDAELLDEAFGYLKQRQSGADGRGSIGRRGRAPALCAARVSARLRGHDTQDANADRRTADRGHMFLLSRGPRHLRRRSLGENHGVGHRRSVDLGESFVNWTQFLRFLATGGIAAAVNLGSRHLLSRVMEFEIAVVIAYLFGMITAYTLARLIVFESSGRSFASEFQRFVIVNFFALALVWVISVGLARYLFPALDFTWHSEDVAHFLGVAAPAVTSYFGHRLYTFARVQT